MILGKPGKLISGLPPPDEVVYVDKLVLMPGEWRVTCLTNEFNLGDIVVPRLAELDFTVRYFDEWMIECEKPELFCFRKVPAVKEEPEYEFVALEQVPEAFDEEMERFKAYAKRLGLINPEDLETDEEAEDAAFYEEDDEEQLEIDLPIEDQFYDEEHDTTPEESEHSDSLDDTVTSGPSEEEETEDDDGDMPEQVAKASGE